MPSHFIAIDTETTGFPPRRPAAEALAHWEAWDGCRVVQIAWQVYEEESGKNVATGVHVVRPDGFTIPERAAAVHGYSTERAMAEGVDIGEALAAFAATMAAYPDATYVAHNMDFDAGIIVAELARARMVEAETFVAARKHCTMVTNTPPKGRWPRLGVLYANLFGHEMEGAHTADGDAQACAAIYMARHRA
jgi:DNA polymerase III epsilon subunit-like protein